MRGGGKWVVDRGDRWFLEYKRLCGRVGAWYVHLFAHSLTRSLIHSLTDSFAHSLVHLFILAVLQPTSPVPTQRGRVQVPLRNVGSKTFLLAAGVDLAFEAARGKRVLDYGFTPASFVVALGGALGVGEEEVVAKVQARVAEAMKSLVY